ncbi:MAG TPA: efflux RND transporter periplasmic adaptor subunit [Planctomycetes bacterium]|nr:efflux RND transporter periplasmic adaptor subunit [Planctomycetota bacterium]
MKWVLNLGLSLVLLGGAAFLAVWLIRTRPKPGHSVQPETAVLVRTMRARKGREVITVRGMGTVIPARKVVLQPEVGGRVVEQAQELVPGGRLAAGETVLRIDPRDYRLALAQKQAQLEKARLDLAVEEGRRRVALKEWESLKKGMKGASPDKALVLREPYIKNARAALDAASSGVEKARLDLERTNVKAPFNSLVLSENTEVGQVVTPQTQLAVLAGTDTFWVQTVLPVESLRWIEFPPSGKDTGPSAKVIQLLGEGKRILREGKVLRLLGDLEAQGRMARVLVAVEDPLLLHGSGEGESLPLLLGSYVRVEIRGKEVDGVFALPRTALHDGDKVWVMGEDDRLEIRPVSVLFRERKRVLIDGGLGEGERIVVSPIPIPAPGLKLKTQVEPTPALPPGGEGK